MELYIFVYILAILGMFFSFKNSKIANIFFHLLSISLILMVCLREEHVGADTYNYLYTFIRPNDIHAYYASSKITEPGLSLFNNVVRYIWNNKYFYSFVLSLLSLLPVFSFMNKYSCNKNISIFLFMSFSIGSSFWILSFSMLRQFLSLGVFALMLDLYLRNDRKLNLSVIILFVIMFLIHNTSLLVLPLLIIDKIRISKFWYFFVSIISWLFSGMLNDFSETLQLFMGAYDFDFYFNRVSDNSFSYLTMIPTLGVFLLTIYYISVEEINSLYVKGFFLAIVLTNLMMCFGNNVDRMVLYYYIPTFIAVPILFKKNKNKSLPANFLFFFIIAIYFTYKYFMVVISMGTLNNGMVPYRSFI